MSWEGFWRFHGTRNYTPVFHEFFEAQIADPRVPLLLRVLAWVLRNSWGYHSDAVVNSDGARLTQVDCARALNLFRKNKKGEMEPYRVKVNAAFKQLARLNMLWLEGKSIFPIDPSQPNTFAYSSLFVKPVFTNGEERAKKTVAEFLEEVWKVVKPKAYEEYQKAESHYKGWRVDLMNDYRAHYKPHGEEEANISVEDSTSEDEKESDNLYKWGFTTEEDIEERNVKKGGNELYKRGFTNPAPSLDINREHIEGEWVSEEDPLTHSKNTIASKLSESGFPLEPEDKLLDDFVSLATDNAISAASLCRAIVEKIRQKQAKSQEIFSPGALYGYVKKFLPQWIAQHGREIEIDRRFAATGTAQEEHEPQHSREDYEALLADPAVSEHEKRIAREMLGYPEAERKPAEHERRAATMKKAGQR